MRSTLPLMPPQPDAERQVEALARRADHRVAVDAVGHHDGGEGVGGAGGILAEVGQPPGRHRRAHACGQEVMPRVDCLQALLLDQHRQRLAQAEEEQGCRRVGEEAGRVVADDRPPVEEVARRAAPFGPFQGARPGAEDPNPRRQHQALLAAGQRHVHAPGIEAEGIEASELTVSTISRASCPARSSAVRIAPMSEVTPVEVSLWTTSTAA